MDEQTAKIISRMQGEIDRLKAIEIPTRICVARYTTNAGQSIGTGGSSAIIDFEDLSIDTDSAVTVGAAWKFTCPTGKGGIYHVEADVTYASTAWAASNVAQLFLYKNGALYSVLRRKTMESAVTLYNNIHGSDTISLAAGDYIDIRTSQNTGGAVALHTDGLNNHVSIYRI